MSKNTQARTDATPGAEDQSADGLIRESIESRYPPLVVREQAKELLHCQDRLLDEMLETRELQGFQRKRGKSGSRVLISRESIIRWLVERAK